MKGRKDEMLRGEKAQHGDKDGIEVKVLLWDAKYAVAAKKAAGEYEPMKVESLHGV